MAENIEKLILDDTEFINPLNDVIKKLDQTQKALKDMNATSQKEMQKTAIEAVKSAKAQEESMKSVITTIGKGSEAYKKHSGSVNEIAVALSKVPQQAQSYVKFVEKLQKLKAEGIGLEDINVEEIGKDFDFLAEKVGLTQDQLNFLQENLIDVSEELKKMSTQSAINFLEEATQSANKLGNELKDLSGSNLKEMRERLDQMALSGDTTSDEFKELAKEIGLFQARITQADREVQLYSKSTDALSTALGELEDRMYDLALAGQQDTEEFRQLRDQVIKMKTAIVDVDKQVDVFVDKKTGFQSFADSVQLVGASFQIAEGYAALFGDENKDFQESLIKLNGIMAITSGIEQARNILIEQSRTKTGLYAVATTALTVSQIAYNYVLGNSTGLMKLFKIALISTGVGALVLGLIALITNFDQVKKAVKNMFPILDKLGSIVMGVKNVFVDAFSGIGTLISNIAKGNFSEVLGTFKDLGKNAAQSFNEGFAENEAQKVRDAMAKDIDNVVKNQKRKLEIMEAGGKETFELQKTILGNELASLKLAGAEREEIENKQHEIQVLNAEREKELADKRAAEAEAAAQRRKEALDKFKEIMNTLKEEEAKGLTGEELFNFEKSKAIEYLSSLRDELIKVAKTLGKDVNAEIMTFDSFIQQIEQRELIQIPVELKPIDPKQIISNLQIPKIVIPTPVIPEPDPTNFLTGINNFDDLFSKLLDDVFGPDAPKAKEFLQGAALFVSEFGNILNEATDLQINSIDKQLDALSERRDELESDLENELALQEKGLANNVDNKKSEVEGILAEEKRLEAERDKLQKESQRRQIIADSITQGQSLITASINIIKGFSAIPVVGLPLGIAAAATLFGFFVKTKADALKATKLYTGAEKISDHFGYANRSGETDLPGRGLGYRLIDEKTGKPTNVIISGKEMLLPESVSLPNSEFFHSLKNGMYNGIDLNTAVGFYLNYNKQARQTTSKQVVNVVNKQQPVRNRKTLVPYSKNGKHGAVLIDIKDDWKSGHFIEIDL